MNSVSGRHALIRWRLSAHCSRSMSGGGVGGSTKLPSRKRTPAVSPTIAMPLSGIEVAHVVRRVPWRVTAPRVASGCADSLAASEDCHRVFRNRQKLSPQTIHIRAPQPRRAGEQFVRSGHVRRAFLVHEHAERRVGLHEGAGGARVVQMDVRQEKHAHVRQVDARLCECAAQYRQRARWTWIDERNAGRTMKNDRRNDARNAKKLQIKVRKAGRKRDHEFDDGMARRLRATMIANSTTTMASAMRPERPIHFSSSCQLWPSV